MIPVGCPQQAFCTGPLIGWSRLTNSINILNVILKGVWGGTMTERRQWKAEEKLALINEIKEKGQVVETCRKYGADPAMFYRRKEIFEAYGIEGFRSGTRHSDPSIRKLTNENERLKKMLAEKELEVSMFQEAYKKR